MQNALGEVSSARVNLGLKKAVASGKIIQIRESFKLPATRAGGGGGGGGSGGNLTLKMKLQRKASAAALPMAKNMKQQRQGVTLRSNGTGKMRPDGPVRVSKALAMSS